MASDSEQKHGSGIQVGPDLNSSKASLDKKLYRQILLPNGLRAVLVSDVMAMHYMQSEGGGMLYGDEDEEESDEEGNDAEITGNKEHHKMAENQIMDSDEESEDESEEGNYGLRDAAAAITVGVGSYSDPPDCLGMAHFLEHLLFMGSEKYPGENDYDVFMSKHGGSENAFTEGESTTYYFSIPQEYLGGALDRLAQFFISPLLLKSGVDRELNAIESEYQLNKQSDHGRLQQLWSTTCGNSDHPFSKFSWGNIKSLKEIPESLNVDPMERLRMFYDKHYYGANMRLVVTGAYSLDALQNLVVKYYSDIPSFPRDGSQPFCKSGKQSALTWDSIYESPLEQYGQPFAPSAFKLYRIIPVKDRHNLSMTWQLPPQFHLWKSKPCDYLGHLLGHEGQGSLLSALKKKSWVTSCVAGIGGDSLENCSSHALFTMTFTLSVEGVNQWPHIIAAVYTYIGMLRHYGSKLPEWIYNELRSLHDFSYRYGDEKSPEDLVQDIVEDMTPCLNLPPERLLDGNELLFEYKPEEIQNILECFKPENSRVDFMSTTFGRVSDFEDSPEAVESHDVLESSIEFDREAAGPPKKDPWFGTYYWVEEFSPAMLREWTNLASPRMPPADSELSLPPKNPFVPTKFCIKEKPPEDTDHPLINCSLKLCIVVGKQKQWLPATVTKYNGIKNEMLVSYEDEDEKWHKVDLQPADIRRECNFESTLDGKKIKFRVVAVPQDGEGAVRKFGDSTDDDVLEGTRFPAIPPAKPASRLPQLYANTPSLRLWHMQDRTYQRPTAELRVALFSGRANDSALHRACGELIVQLCHDALTEYVYMAALCELGTMIESSENGFGFRIHGFDDKLLSLFEVVFRTLLSFRGRPGEDGLPKGMNDGRFHVCKEQLQRKYENSGMEAPTMASSVRIRCVCPRSWSAFQKNEAIKSLDIPTFIEIAAQMLDKLSVEALFHGNVGLAEAKDAKDLIEALLESSGGHNALSRKKFYTQQVSQLPFNKEPILITLPSKDTESGNTAVEAYFQVGKDNVVDRVIIDMLVQLMAEPLYAQVRTKDQFGYRVSCDSRWTVGIMGLKFVIVTASKSAAATTERIDKFLTDFRTELVNMKAEDYMENLVALAKEKLDMFNSLAEETSCFWNEIRDCRYDWEVNRNEALALRNVTKEQVLDAFDKWLNPNSPERRVVFVQVICGLKDGGDAALGRPEVTPAHIGSYCDDRVHEFHEICKKQVWGTVYPY